MAILTTDAALDAVAPILELCLERWMEESCELLDSWELPELLVKHGLAKREPYDPGAHGSSFTEIEPGEPFYILTPLAWMIRDRAKALKARETSHAS